ncbi:MAG: PilZ domain-containing protein [Phycisphaerales bacterium]|nr:PilZ domain-containing protein [Phycisphaerales bacterium]
MSDSRLVNISRNQDANTPLAHSGSSADRRRNVRLDVERPCKVVIPAAGRSVSARTSNVSVTGALLRVDSPRLLNPGETVRLAICWTNAPIVREDQLVAARVVRALGIQGEAQTVAVEFANSASQRAEMPLGQVA